MSHTTYAVIRPFTGRLSITRLSVVLKIFVITKRVALTSAIFIVTLTGIQLVYPSHMSRPFTKVANTKMSLMSEAEIISALKQHSGTKYQIVIDGKTYNVDRNQTGIDTDYQLAASQITNYPLTDRLAPFSLFKSTYEEPIPQKIDDNKLKAFSESFAKDKSTAPIDATAIKQANGRYEIRASIQGKSYSSELIASHIKSASQKGKYKFEVRPVAIQPKITTDDYQQAINKLDAKAKQQVNLSYGGKTYLLTGDVVRQWSVLTPDPAKGEVSLAYDKAAIKTWLDRTLPTVLQTPKSTIVSVVDGAIAGRSAAQPGVGLDSETSTIMISRFLEDSSTTPSSKINLATKPLAPKEVRVTSYTPTSAGIQAVINDWQKDHPGLVSSVSFIEIGGLGRQASLNPNKLMPAASIYKIYVSLYLLKGIEGGSINASDPAVNGKNIAQCIEAMFVVSDNPCGETLAGRFGWSVIDSFIAANGFAATVLNQSPVKTTAADTANYLVRLQAGQLVNAGNTAQVLDYMSRQIYRSAIPAGSPGASVADKVGYTGGIWNDAAIVKGKGTTYILVVMTQNGNPAVIKDLALRIHNLIDP